MKELKSLSNVDELTKRRMDQASLVGFLAFKAIKAGPSRIHVHCELHFFDNVLSEATAWDVINTFARDIRPRLGVRVWYWWQHVTDRFR